MSDRPPALKSARWTDLGVRAASAFVLVVVAVGTALLGGPVFVLIWLAASIAVLWEWQAMIDASRTRAPSWVGAILLGIVGTLVWTGYLGPALVLLIVAAATLAWRRTPASHAWEAGGALYAGLLLVAVIATRLSPGGTLAILWLFATVWSTDTFAYFGGRLLGGPKLAPRISPSKTWSGTLTGLAAATIIGTLIARAGGSPATSMLPVAALTLLASALSQAGDAFESAMKRRFGVKDSGRLIPGHGGIMDRVDGFVAAAVFAFCVGLAHDPSSVAGGLFYWG